MQRTLGIVLAVILLILISSTPAYSQVAINQVQGNYVNTDLGFSLVLPGGWQGTQFSSATIVVPGNLIDTITKPEVTIIIAGLDKSEFEKIAYTTSDLSLKINVTESLNLLETHVPNLSGNYFASSDCKDVSSKDTHINGAISFVTERECTGPNLSLKMKAYFVESGDKLVSLIYLATPSTNYDKHLTEFDSSVSTLKIMGVSNNYEMMGLKANSYSIILGGNPIDLNVYSNSTISDLAVSKSTKQVSFTVTGGAGTSGVTVIPIGNIMKGPFVVQFDGQNMTDFKQVKDLATGEISLELRYQHSSHQIIITGTQVVPEFSALATGIFAVSTLVGIMILIMRKRQNLTI